MSLTIVKAIAKFFTLNTIQNSHERCDIRLSGHNHLNKDMDIEMAKSKYSNYKKEYQEILTEINSLVKEIKSSESDTKINPCESDKPVSKELMDLYHLQMDAIKRVDDRVNVID